MGVNLMNDYYDIKIGNCSRRLKLVKSDTISYYSFNMMGDAELNKEAAIELAKLIKNIDVIVTVESKAIGLAEEVSQLLGFKRYIIVRKTKKSYMDNIVSVSGDTIISGSANYYLDGCDVDYLKDKRILVLDDVISTGGTIDAIYRLLSKCNLNIVSFACVCFEGKKTTEIHQIPVLSCAFFPLPESDND